MRHADQTSAGKPVSRRAALWTRWAAAGALIAAMAAVSGCGGSEPEPGAGTETLTEIEDVQLDAVREVVPDANLEYKRVTVPGQVDAVISPGSFSISDPAQPLVDPLLIVHKDDVESPEPATGVNVTGIVYRGFDAAAVEKETGIDLDPALHEQWQGDSYIVASEVAPR